MGKGYDIMSGCIVSLSRGGFIYPVLVGATLTKYLVVPLNWQVLPAPTIKLSRQKIYTTIATGHDMRSSLSQLAISN